VYLPLFCGRSHHVSPRRFRVFLVFNYKSPTHKPFPHPGRFGSGGAPGGGPPRGGPGGGPRGAPRGPPRGAPRGGRPQTACFGGGAGGPPGAPRGVPPREGPPDPPRGPLGPTETPPGPPQGPPRTPPGPVLELSVYIPGPDAGSAPGAPPGGPPGPAPGPRPPLGGAPPRGDEGIWLVYKHAKEETQRGETWCDRPQKRGKNTHKGLKLGPFWAPLQGAHPVRFWGGPPAPPLAHGEPGLGGLLPPAGAGPFSGCSATLLGPGGVVGGPRGGRGGDSVGPRGASGGVRGPLPGGYPAGGPRVAALPTERKSVVVGTGGVGGVDRGGRRIIL
jgi:hypothetical protein